MSDQEPKKPADSGGSLKDQSEMAETVVFNLKPAQEGKEKDE